MSSFPHLPSPAMGLLMALMDSPSSAKAMILDQLSSSISSLRNGFLRRCSRWDGNNVEEGQGRATSPPTVRTSQEVVVQKRGEFQAEECSICWEMLRDSDASVLMCGHAFHARCIGAWLHRRGANTNTCPLCRHSIS
eukprot:symbB.v1.2.004205.t1/scaffold238.1/size305685/8